MGMMLRLRRDLPVMDQAEVNTPLGSYWQAVVAVETVPRIPLLLLIPS